MSEQQVLDVCVRVIEGAGALIILVGAALAFGRFVVEGLRHRDPEVFVDVRLGLGRFLALGLEFQLAGAGPLPPPRLTFALRPSPGAPPHVSAGTQKFRWGVSVRNRRAAA